MCVCKLGYGLNTAQRASEKSWAYLHITLILVEEKLLRTTRTRFFIHLEESTATITLR